MALWIGEPIVVGSTYFGDFITGRLFGLYKVLGGQGASGLEEAEGLDKLRNLDLLGNLRDFYASPELWLGVLAAALLLLGAMWVRRYREESASPAADHH